VIKKKSIEWLKRYLPLEIVGTITALVGAGAASALHQNLIVIAYAGSLGESIGFYTTALIQNIWREKAKLKLENKKFKFPIISKICTQILLEFGPAGAIDGLLLRPFLMYVFPILLNNVMLGIFIGKIVGDVSFYFLLILSYEIIMRRQNHLKNT